MSRTLAGLVLLAFVAGVSWLSVALLRAPEPVPASAPPEEFSAERALEHVRALAGAPRPLGTAAHDRARDHVLGELRELGLDPRVQAATGRSGSGRAFGSVENVLARVDGTGGGDGAVLLLAHYDSVPAGPGASDDAVGVAVALETLRALRAGPPPERDVIALLSDGEEAGLLGVEAFVHEHPWAGDVFVVLNFEARGTRGPSLMFETGPGNRALIQRFAAAAPYPVAASYSYEVYRRLPNDTDFTVFREAGIPGLNFAHIHGAVGYHTARDSVERLDPASLQHHGSNALALARAFAVSGVVPGDGGGGDAVYFNPLGWTFVRFPAAWVPGLLGLAVFGALAIVVLALVRRRLGLGGLAAGLVVWVLVLVVVGGLPVLVQGLVLPGFYDFRVFGDGSSVAWALFGAILAALGLGLALHGAARRLVSPTGLAAGGLVLWAAGTVGVSLAAPGASYLFLVPLAGQLPAVGWLLARRTREGDGEAGTREIPLATLGLLALGGAVAALVWAPALALVAVGLQAGALGVVAALAALLLALLSPQLEVAGSGRLRWRVPAVLLVAGGVVIVSVRLASGHGPDDPEPTSLIYALDADSGEARWATFEDDPSPWTRRVLPEEPARESLEPFVGLRREPLTGPAPDLGYPAATVERVGVERVGTGPHVRVVPPPGAHRLRLFLDPVADLRSVTVAGREATIPEDDEALSRVYSLVYFAPPADGVELELETAGAGAPDLAVVAQWYGLPDEGEGGPPPRSADLMPASWPWETDSVLVRTEASLDAPPAEPAQSPVE